MQMCFVVFVFALRAIGAESAEAAQPPQATTSGDTSAEDIKVARESLREAWKDASSLLGTGRSVFEAMQPRLLTLARTRVQTFQDAISEFMAGYRDGAQQVRVMMSWRKDGPVHKGWSPSVQNCVQSCHPHCLHDTGSSAPPAWNASMELRAQLV
jgi:hypothetical protein